MKIDKPNGGPTRNTASGQLTFTLFALLLIFLHAHFPKALPDDKLTIGLFVAALLPWLSTFMSKLEITGIGKFEFRELKKEVEQTRADVASLYALSMSHDAFRNLKKLSGGNFGGFFLDPNGVAGIGFELRYLKVLGYIAFDKVPGIMGIGNLPKGDNPNDDLSKYIRVTEQGQQFIALREATTETV